MDQVLKDAIVESFMEVWVNVVGTAVIVIAVVVLIYLFSFRNEHPTQDR